MHFARRVAFVMATLFVGVASPQLSYLVATAGAGLVLCDNSRSARWLSLPMLVLLTVLSLIKTTFLFYSLVALGVAACCLLLQRRWRRALLSAAGFGLFFCAAWLLLGQK